MFLFMTSRHNVTFTTFRHQSIGWVQNGNNQICQNFLKKKMIIIRSIPCMQSYLKNKRFVFFFLCWELCLEINDGLAYYCHLHLIWNLKLDCLHFCSQTYKYLIHFRALIWNIEMIKLWIIYRYKIIYIKCMLIKEKY